MFSGRVDGGRLHRFLDVGIGEPDEPDPEKGPGYQPQLPGAASQSHQLRAAIDDHGQGKKQQPSGLEPGQMAAHEGEKQPHQKHAAIDGHIPLTDGDFVAMVRIADVVAPHKNIVAVGDAVGGQRLAAVHRRISEQEERALGQLMAGGAIDGVNDLRWRLGADLHEDGSQKRQAHIEQKQEIQDRQPMPHDPICEAIDARSQSIQERRLQRFDTLV